MQVNCKISSKWPGLAWTTPAGAVPSQFRGPATCCTEGAQAPAGVGLAERQHGVAALQRMRWPPHDAYSMATGESASGFELTLADSSPRSVDRCLRSAQPDSPSLLGLNAVALLAPCRRAWGVERFCLSVFVRAAPAAVLPPLVPLQVRPDYSRGTTRCRPTCAMLLAQARVGERSLALSPEMLTWSGIGFFM